MGFDATQWHEFAVAAAGVGAALTGLLFVAMSINIERILGQATLPIRAGETLIILVSVLLVSLLLLVPGQPNTALGAEVVLLGVVLAAVFTRTRLHAFRGRAPGDPPEWSYVPAVIVAVSTLPLLVGGITLIAGAGGGIYWLLAATIVGIVGASINAWIFLVEILR